MAYRNRSSMVTFLAVGLAALIVTGGVAWRILDNKKAEVRTPAVSTDKPALETAGRAADIASADRPTETINVLSSTLQAVTGQLKNLGAEVMALRDGEDAQKNRLEAEIKARDADIARLEAQLEDRVQETQSGLRSQIEDLFTARDQAPDYPVTPRSHGELGADGGIWFGQSGQGAVAGAEGISTLPERVAGLDRYGISNANQRAAEVLSIPVYSIPPQATLVRARSLTAIIGRVPIQGNVSDPLPFKIITSGANLMPNSHTLPELAEAIWSGVAIGDAALHCVTGRLTQVTFIFADGTISSWPEQAKPDDRAQIAWIANERGYPCIPGTLVSTIGSTASKLGFAALAAGIASGVSESQVTTVQGSAGNVSRTVTGSVGEYALGQAASAGIAEWSRYMAERAKDVFDAVVVQPGQTVTIHTASLIPIDYDPAGRRLRHLSAQTATTPERAGGLD